MTVTTYDLNGIKYAVYVDICSVKWDKEKQKFTLKKLNVPQTIYLKS